LPFVVRLDQDTGRKAMQGSGIGEDPDDISPSLDLSIQPLY
jgi:hypothetical protein